MLYLENMNILQPCKISVTWLIPTSPWVVMSYAASSSQEAMHFSVKVFLQIYLFSEFTIKSFL